MSSAEAIPQAGDAKSRMQAILTAQRQAHIKDGPPSAEKRIEWIDRAIGLLVGHKDADRRGAARGFRPPLGPCHAC